MNNTRNLRWHLTMVAFGILLGVMIALLGCITGSVVHAEDGNKAERTIIYYNDGASSEEINKACSDMLMEAMAAKFDSKKIRFIVMTGGSLKWHLAPRYLRDKNGEADKIDAISTEYNQVWELFGATDTSEGYMKLIDGDGVTGVEVKSEDELMNDPNTLKTFINFAKNYAPAEKYDLIMLDHGSGPGHGYGLDDHDKENPNKKLHVYEMREAISECDVVQDEGKFDMIFLECCMNGNFETLLALQDYADYFIGSPDVDPINSVEYTDVLNFLNEEPDMDAKKLGKKMVDVFHDYFESHMEERSLGKAVQLSLVDTTKFKESGILNRMQQIAETLRSEAARKRFYDEIRSSQDDYRTYYSYLQDMSTLAEQLGINIKESDLQDPELKNSYTDNAIQVQRILGNEDVIYSRYTSDSKKDDVIFGRDEQGKITVKVGKTPAGGLNIFFPNMHMANIPAEIAHYIDAMDELANRLPDGSDVKTFITTYRQAVIDYALIYEIGTAVSNIVDSEGYDGTVDLDKIKEYFEAEDQKLEDQGLKGENQWGSVSHIIDESDRKDSEWLNEIIEIQKKEVINPKNVAIRKTDKDYLIDITNTPQKIIGVPELRLSAKISHQSSEEGFDFLYKDPLIVYTGELAADAMQDISSFEEFIGGNHSAYRVPLHDGQWYAVKDSNGKIHPASIASDRSVYAAFEFKDGTNKGGELHFDAQGKAKHIYLDGDTKPIDLEIYKDPVKVTLMNHSCNAGMVSGEFEISGTDSRLVRAPYKDLNIKSVDAKLYICDIYGVGHEIALPDFRTKATITTAPAGKTGLTYTGKAQALVKAGIAKGGTMQYALGKNAKDAPTSGWSASIPKGTKAGTYYVWYKVAGDKNHIDTVPKCIIVKISKAITKETVNAKTVSAKMVAKGKKAMTISWSVVKNADGYDVFFARCNHHGKKIKMKKVKTFNSNTKTSYTKKGLKKGASYKAKVRAFVKVKGKKKYIMTSPSMHAFAGNGTKRYTNAKSVSVKKNSITLKKGKTYKIKATVKKAKKNKKLMPAKHMKKLRYMSMNKKIATVSKTGIIKAKAKGKCIIYVYAHNGIGKLVNVTVK